MFYEIPPYSICHIFISEKSADKSGFVDESGCDKSEVGLYVICSDSEKDMFLINILSNEWFECFDIVLNALDNQKARRYVNEMCISRNLPLIESGTGGYEGQCFLIKRNLTPCFECEVSKIFPSY